MLGVSQEMDWLCPIKEKARQRLGKGGGKPLVLILERAREVYKTNLSPKRRSARDAYKTNPLPIKSRALETLTFSYCR